MDGVHLEMPRVLAHPPSRGLGAEMSHYRRLGGGKRDSNEPQIVRRFGHHGWHVEQLSGTAIPDLLCWPMNPRSLTTDSEGLAASVLVDVKEPKGTPTPAQVEKWKTLSEKGIPVYVARTEADVDAIVSGAAEPWGAVEARPKRPLLPSERVSKALRESLPKVLATVAADAGNRLRVVREPDKGRKRAPRTAYEPPRAIPEPARKRLEATIGLRDSLRRAEKATREADETFAPAEPCWHDGGHRSPGPCRRNTPECPI